tara:strand:- start:194 stop:1291 length:1098 start_codon:yes stop_codon:yes gene_type:complete
MSDRLKRTPFYAQHLEAGAKMVPFAGFEMPIQYHGIKVEHRAVRGNIGLFDVSHMGEFFVRGPKALELLQLVTVNDVSILNVGKAQYSCMCYEDGGIVDDLIIYRLASEEYMMVVNGANIDKDWDWLLSQNTMGAEIENVSNDYVLLALQGPKSAELLSELTDTDIQRIPFYAFEYGEVSGVPSLISATGYTGEKGFELYFNSANYDVSKVFEALVAKGAAYGLELCGLGARDTLRLEKGYALYGNEITEETNPLQARLGWIVKFSKGLFVGSQALVEIKDKGVEKKLVGFVVDQDKAIPRKDYDLLDTQFNIVGKVTSGGMSISLEKGIGMAYIQTDALTSNGPIIIQIRNKEVPITVTSLPFL